MFAKQTFGFVLATLRAHRDHQTAGNEFALLVGAGSAGHERDLVVCESTLE